MRRNFILLEVFMALALISLAVIPITSYPYKIYCKELESLQQIEREHLYDLAMASFIKALTTSLTWDQVEGIHTLEKYQSIISKETSYPAQVNVVIENEAPNHRLLKCTLQVGSEERQYSLLIHKISVAPVGGIPGQ